MSVLCIDPGLNSMGWAFWKKDIVHGKPDDVGLVRDALNLELPWHIRAIIQTDGLVDVLKNRRILPTEVYCEMPEYYHTAIGTVVAQSHSTYKLSYLVGCLGITFKNLKFTLLLPRMWKGQLPKHAVETRIIRALGRKACVNFKDDIWDAVGMGLSLKGYL